MTSDKVMPKDRSDYSIALIYIYALLWISLATYIAASISQPEAVAVQVTAAVLLVAVLLHLIASTAPSVSSIWWLIVAIIVLTLPTALLLVHRTSDPALYFAYLALHATIAAYIVDVHVSATSTVPRWLAACQVGYLIVLGLDTLGRVLPTLLYPAVDLAILAALHTLADIRVLLLFPIAIAWIVIAIIRCRTDGSFDTVPVVWRTDISVFKAVARLPVRFASAIGTFIEIVVRRIGRDFLYSFREHSLYLARYVLTIVATGTIMLGARAFAPWLVKYLRTPTSPSDILRSPQTAATVVTPLAGFLIFLLIPFLNAALAVMWRPELPLQRVRQRAYQVAVYAAVPCALIGPLFWLGSKWFSLPGFSRFGIVSIAVVLLVVLMLAFGARLRVLDAEPPAENNSPDVAAAVHRDVRWRDGLSVALFGALLTAVLLLLGITTHGSFPWPGVPASTPATTQALSAPDAKLTDRRPVIQALAPGHWRYYSFDVPSGAARLRVYTNNSAGIELYTNVGVKPQENSYACRSALLDRTEDCVHDSPKPGRWFVALHGTSAPAMPTLTAELTYNIEGTTGTPNVIIHCEGVAARSDVAVNAVGGYAFSAGAGTYTITPRKENCAFTPASRIVSVGPSLSDVNFTVQCNNTPLTNSVSLVNESVAYHQWRFYTIVVPEATKTLNVAVDASADVDLYTNFGESPAPNRRSCQAAGSSYSERCTQNAPSAGEWWIGVYGFSPATYSIRASYE